MSFSFPTPSATLKRNGPSATSHKAASYWGLPVKLLFAVLASVEALLLLTGGHLAYVVLALMAVPAFIVWRTRKVRSSNSARRSANHDRTHSNKTAFLETGNRMIAKCRRDNQPLSIIVFEQSDLPELQCIFGVEIANEMAGKLASTLQSMVKSKGLALRTDPTVFTVLLPGFGRDRALDLVKCAFGNTLSIEFDAQGDEVVLVPDFLIQTVRDEKSIKEVYSELRKNIKRSQENELCRQQYLKRERESHSSRPMPLMESDSKYDRTPRHEMTVPVPLGMR